MYKTQTELLQEYKLICKHNKRELTQEGFESYQQGFLLSGGNIGGLSF